MTHDGGFDSEGGLYVCREVVKLIEGSFLITGCEFRGHEKGDCVLMFEKTGGVSKALQGHLGLLQLKRLFVNIEKQTLNQNMNVIDCTFLENNADPITFCGHRVRYVDGLKCLSVTRKHLQGVCSSLEKIEDILRNLVYDFKESSATEEMANTTTADVHRVHKDVEAEVEKQER